MQSPATPPSSASRRASSIPLRSPGRNPERNLTVTGRPLPRAAARATRDRALGLGQQRRPGAGLAHLRNRAAHVDVDQIRARGGDPLGGRGHHVGVGAEQLHRDRVLVGMDPQAAPGRSARCGSARRGWRPSPRRPARRRSAWPAGARTSCRCPPAAPARRGWRSGRRRAPRDRSVRGSVHRWTAEAPWVPWRSSRIHGTNAGRGPPILIAPWAAQAPPSGTWRASCSTPTRTWVRTIPTG